MSGWSPEARRAAARARHLKSLRFYDMRGGRRKLVGEMRTKLMKASWIINREVKPSGPYFRKDNGKDPIVYLDWMESRDPAVFFEIVRRLKATGRPVYADFTNRQLREAFDRRYAV